MVLLGVRLVTTGHGAKVVALVAPFTRPCTRAPTKIEIKALGFASRSDWRLAYEACRHADDAATRATTGGALALALVLAFVTASFQIAELSLQIFQLPFELAVWAG